PPAALADEWFTPGRFLALLALCLFAAFPEVILGSHTFYYRDFGHFAYPLAHYHRECFWRGEIPLWNPYSSCGLPHLAQWNTMCLYPGALIYLLGPMPWALGWFSLAHLLLAGAGAYRLAHHWTGNRFAASVAGLAFAFNGFTLHAVMWPNNVAALAWAPWLWLRVERACKEGGRTILLAALIGAMQMLSGAPEIILFTWAIAALLALVEGKGQKAKGKNESFGRLRPAAFFLLTFVLVLLLSAAQLLPFLDLLSHSHRTAGYDDNLYAMPLWGWANFFVPLFRMTPDKLGVFTHVEQQWTSSYYPSLGVLALAALAVWRRREPRVWLLAAVTVVGVWLAMGRDAFLLDWLKAIFPPLGFIRFPIKYVLLPLMALPFLAAFGITVVQLSKCGDQQTSPSSDIKLQRARNHPLILVTFTLLAICAGVLIWGASEKHFGVTLVFAVASAQAVLGAAVLIHRRNGFGGLTPPLPALVALVFIAADILSHAPRQNPTVITQAYEPGVAKFSTTMPRLGEGRAMVSREMEGFMAHAQNTNALNYCISSRRAAFANWNLLDAVPKVNGMFSQFPRELSDTWWLLYGNDRPFPEHFADFLGITRISSSETLFTWAHRTNALPLVTAGAEPIFTDAASTLRELAGSGFDPKGNVFLPKELTAVSPATNASAITRATALSTRWEREAISIDVEANAPVWVVIAQTYYHPWKAFEGERELPIRRANHAFQAVEIPAGRHHLELRYVDHAFRLGAAISITTLALVLFGLLCPRAPLKTEH
ncbi:MAG: hypothetical protein EBY09_00865, partial [Verrucomicrobia bacterium]|nr:hypothetical protein [Verrucomicrobiota bacterium]NDE96871.1 hypothetical protein [Verrucomicrobiota bacterium]